MSVQIRGGGEGEIVYKRQIGEKIKGTKVMMAELFAGFSDESSLLERSYFGGA